MGPRFPGAGDSWGSRESRESRGSWGARNILGKLAFGSRSQVVAWWIKSRRHPEGAGVS